MWCGSGLILFFIRIHHNTNDLCCFDSQISENDKCICNNLKAIPGVRLSALNSFASRYYKDQNSIPGEMKFLTDYGKIAVEIYFAADDIIRIIDCSCGVALDTLKGWFGNRMRSDAFLRDNLGILQRADLLSLASGDVWFANGVKIESVSVFQKLTRWLYKRKAPRVTYLQLESRCPSKFKKASTCQVVPLNTIAPKIVQVQAPSVV